MRFLKKILKRVSIIRECDLTCLLVHSELLSGNLTTYQKVVHLKISSECTYIQSSNFFSKHLGADVRLWLLMWMFVDAPARHYLSAHLCNDKCVRTQANARFTCMCILVRVYVYAHFVCLRVLNSFCKSGPLYFPEIFSQVLVTYLSNARLIFQESRFGHITPLLK